MGLFEIKSYKARYWTRIALGVLTLLLIINCINSIEQSYNKLYEFETTKNIIEFEQINFSESFNNYEANIIKPSEKLVLHRDITFKIINIIGYVGFGILLIMGDKYDKVREY